MTYKQPCLFMSGQGLTTHQPEKMPFRHNFAHKLKLVEVGEVAICFFEMTATTSGNTGAGAGTVRSRYKPA